MVFDGLVGWISRFFGRIKEKFDFPIIVYPALGGLGAGIITLKYPGILYWGFTNVEEILHTGKSASAPGMWLLTHSLFASSYTIVDISWNSIFLSHQTRQQ